MNIARFDLVDGLSTSRRVGGSRTFLDFDLTDLLGSLELQQFQEETGLEKSPVTLVLPDRCPEGRPPSASLNQVVVAFLHGLGGGRRSWGIREAARERQESFVLKVLRSVEGMGKEAVGLVLAGLGRDGGSLNPIVGEGGITPQHYSRQLEFVLQHLKLSCAARIVGIGHSVGAAALWEFASRHSTNGDGRFDAADRRSDVSIVAISPVRAIAESRFLTVGCRIAGKGLDLLLRPVVELWRFSSRRLSSYLATASVLKGLGQQGPFGGSLAGVKGLVLIGERDWVARVGLAGALRRASCKWPIAELAGLGHNLLGHPATERVLMEYLPNLL